MREDGAFVLGDVVKPDVSAFTDAAALLGLAAANGFFFAALFGLVRTLLSGYWKLRQQAGLTRYSEDDDRARSKPLDFPPNRPRIISGTIRRG